MRTKLYLLFLLVLTVLAASQITQALPNPNLYSINKDKIINEWWRIDRDRDFLDDLLENEKGLQRVFIIFENKPNSIYRYWIEKLGGRVLYEYKYVLNGYDALIPMSKINEFFYVFKQIDLDRNGYADILYVQKPRTYKPMTHWATREIDVRPRVWSLGYMGEGVRVAVLDTGIYLDGRGFNKSNIEFYDLVNSRTTPYDEVGHGTMVSFCIAGNITPSPSLGEEDNEILTTYIDYIHVTTDTYYYITGPILVTSNVSNLDIYGMVVLYNTSAQGMSNFISSAYLVHYPSYTVDDWGAYDSYVALNVDYVLLSNNYYLANLTLSSPINNASPGLYTIWVKFDASALDYLAEVMGVAYAPLQDDGYPATTGVAPKAGLVVFKVGDSNGIYTNLAAQALDTIAGWNSDNDPGNDVNVASMSFGGPSSDPTFYQAIKNAMDYGVLSVVAAGNDGAGANNAGNTYPAAYPEVLTVAATNTLGNITIYSSQGGLSAVDSQTIKPDVSAPGGSYYGPLAMRDSDGDAEVVFETGDAYEIEHNDTQTAMGTSFATPVVSGLAALIIEVFKEKGVWSNDRFHVLLVKSIIEASTHETYPLIREKDPNNSPSLDRGGKDVHEGYGMVDGYSAIALAERTADLLRYWNGLSPSYSYDYGLDDNVAPFINVVEYLRDGVMYNVSSVNNLLDIPLGSSSYVLPIHFERYTWVVNGTEYNSRYGIRLIINSSDPVNTDFDTVLYLFNSSLNDLVLLNNTSGGTGVLDETMYFTPPSDESSNDYIYYVAVKRASEDSAGGYARLVVGPGLEARFVNGRYIWVNATAATPASTAPYALILVYYRNATGTYVHRQALASTTDLNGFAHVEGYVKIIDGLEDGVLERLQDDYEWFVGIVFTVDERVLSNLTLSSVVEGPVVVRVDIGEPTILDITAPSTVYDHETFALTARLVYNDTGSPVPGATVWFYRSTDLSTWSYIGENTTDTNGYAYLYISEPSNGTYYYLAVYPGDNTTQYTWTGYAVSVTVYLVTNISITVSNTNPYTVEPVNITVKLVKKATGEPLPGETVTIWISYDNGATWNTLYSGATDLNGELRHTHFFLSSGTYLLKANYSGNPTYYILGSESSNVTVNSVKTPSNATTTINNTDLRVYDTVGFTVHLIYEYDNTSGNIVNATVYLEMFNNTNWVIVCNDTTDNLGYATLTYRFTRNGTYTFRIHYLGNETFTEYVSDNITLLVKSLATQILLISTPSSGSVNTTLYATVQLLDEKNRAVSGEVVVLQKNVSGTWVDVANATTGSDGKATLTWSESQPGNYTYRVYYGGRDYVYNSSVSNTFTVTIEKIATGLTLTSNTTLVYVNETFQLIARLVYDSTPVSGKTIYFQVWNGTDWVTIGSNTTDDQGYAYLAWSEMYAGNYTYRAWFPGDDTYNESISNNVTVDVEPIPTEINLTIPATAYTVDEVLIVAVVETIDGKPVAGYTVEFWISSDGVNWVYLGSNTTDSTGKAVYRHVFWVNGTYIVKANFTDPGKNTGEWIYGDSGATENITINTTPVNIDLSSNATKVYINQTIEFTVNITDVYGNPLNGLTVEVIYNGTVKYTLTTVNGIASWTDTYTAYYVYEIKVHYPGNQTYSEAYSSSLIVEWQPLYTTTSLTVSNPNPAPGETIVLTATVYDTIYGKPVVGYDVEFWVSVNGSAWSLIGTATTNSDGRASITYTLGYGVYDFKAVFKDPDKGVMGQWKYYSSESSVVRIATIELTPTNLTLISDKTEAYVYDSITLKAKLVRTDTGDPIQDETVKFYAYINGNWNFIGQAKTGYDGVASITTSFSEPGTYIVKAVYEGSTQYASCESNNVTINVSKKPVDISVEINPSKPYVGDDVTIDVTVTSLGEPLGNAEVRLYVNSTLIDAEYTLPDGTASFTINFTDAGTYNITIYYPGSTLYEEKTVTSLIDVYHRTKLTFTVSYEILKNGSILFILKATLYIDDQPVSGETIKFYKKGSWIYIGSNTTDTNGTATLYYVETNETQNIFTFKAEYPPTQSYIEYAESIAQVIIYERPPPTPEPSYLVVVLSLSIIVTMFIYEREKS